VTSRSGVDVSAVHVRIPLRQPFVAATGTWRDHDAWLVRMRGTDGRVGIGEATLGPGSSAADLSELAARIRALVADPAAEAGVVDGPVGAAVGAALLDGAWPMSSANIDPRSSVAVNGTIAVESTDACVGAAREMVAAGFGTLKLKVGSEGSTDELVTRVRLIREAIGPGVALRLDANGSWAEAVARERLEALAPFDLEYVEQPIAAGPPDELARFRADVSVPIAADESVSGVHAAQALLDAGAADVLVVKPARVGAPSVCLLIAERAAAAGVGVVISTLLETGLGIGAALAIAASLPASAREYAHGLATAGLLASDLLLEPLVISGGRIAVPVGSGVAGRLDVDAVRRYTVEWVGEPW
jgi:o-succinylbenzoate synthase